MKIQASSPRRSASQSTPSRLAVASADRLEPSRPPAALWAPQPAAPAPRPPCVNRLTLLNLEPLESVPEPWLFNTHDGYGFDIRELVQTIQATYDSVPINPYTGQLLETCDVNALLAHPSGAAEPLRQVAGSQANISLEIFVQLDDLSRLLARDVSRSQEKVHVAFADLQHCLDNLPHARRQAVGEALPGLDKWLTRAAQPDKCSKLLAGSLRRMLDGKTAWRRAMAQKNPERLINPDVAEYLQRPYVRWHRLPRKVLAPLVAFITLPSGFGADWAAGWGLSAKPLRACYPPGTLVPGVFRVAGVVQSQSEENALMQRLTELAVVGRKINGAPRLVQLPSPEQLAGLAHAVDLNGPQRAALQDVLETVYDFAQAAFR